MIYQWIYILDHLQLEAKCYEATTNFVDFLRTLMLQDEAVIGGHHNKVTENNLTPTESPINWFRSHNLIENWNFSCPPHNPILSRLNFLPTRQRRLFHVVDYFLVFRPRWAGTTIANKVNVNIWARDLPVTDVAKRRQHVRRRRCTAARY